MTKENYYEIIEKAYNMLSKAASDGRVLNFNELCQYLDLATTLAATLYELDKEDEDCYGTYEDC